nr:unnamed protein product [Spirometra erinaceieuropaei]
MPSAGLFPRPEVRPVGRADDKGYPRCRLVNCPSPRHLEDEDSPTAAQETSSNELSQRLANLPISAAADENASMENRALAVLGRARRQHQDWFDDNDVAVSNLLAEMNCLHKAYVSLLINNKAGFYRSGYLVQQRLREMQDARTARKTEEVQGYADRNEWKNFFFAFKAVYGPTDKGAAPLLSADGIILLTDKNNSIAMGRTLQKRP